MKNIAKLVRKQWQYHVLLIPGIIFVFIFNYIPLYGLVIAFQKYNPAMGFNSPWVGLANFEYLFRQPNFVRTIWNTFYIAVFKIVGGIIVPVTFALLLNELRSRTFKRIVQTVTYLPYFISTVIMVSILQMLLSYPRGVVNSALSALGLTEINFFQEAGWFRTLYIGSGIWQGLGWNSILYLAALTSINPDLYEAAYMDGANRLQQMWHISLPGMMNTIVTMLILSLGGIFSVGYEKVYLMYNPVTMDQADVISTYVYRTGLESMRYSYASAIGLFNSVINFAVLLLANTLSRKITEIGLW